MKNWSRWCLFIQLIASDQFNKIEVQLEVVIQPCALLTANGGFEMGTSKLNKLYLELSCYTSIFYIGNSQFKSNNGFTTVMLVVQMNYWDTELWLSEGWDLGFLIPYRENLSVGCPLRTVLLTYKPTYPFNTTSRCHQAACCLWRNHSSVLCPFAKRGWLPWSLPQTPINQFLLCNDSQGHPSFPRTLHRMLVWETPATRAVLGLLLRFVKRSRSVLGPPRCPRRAASLKTALESSLLSWKMLPQGLLMLSVFTACPLRN